MSPDDIHTIELDRETVEALQEAALWLAGMMKPHSAERAKFQRAENVLTNEWYKDEDVDEMDISEPDHSECRTRSDERQDADMAQTRWEAGR